MISNAPSEDCHNLLVWLIVTWGDTHKLVNGARALKGNRLGLAVGEFYETAKVDTIEGLTEGQQQQLCDVMDEYWVGQCDDQMEAY